MKALTLIKPWGWAILRGGKDVENRTWAPPEAMIGETIAIHHGRKVDWSAAEDIVDHLELDELPPEAVDEGIIGLATIERVVRGRWDVEAPDLAMASEWYSGPIGWVLTNKVALPRPIPCRGSLGLWTVPGDVLLQILEQMARRTA